MHLKDMSELADQPCTPCGGGEPALKGPALESYLTQLAHDWQVVDEHHLMKNYTFPDFAQALAFVNRVGVLAEELGHHPDIYFTWGKVRIEIFTHKIDGLAQADFVLAAKCDRALKTA
ncbi:MAG: 4a-hydroxytetrahydrobiopterin dehydratase [Myxococcales bacterium]|nr:4a-hydroxytetrahydrobiopterin dehydratase [Myxococcales bacterium]